MAVIMQRVFLVFTIMAFCVMYAVCSKYSEASNPESNDRSKTESPFRINKVNQVWEKARKRLPKFKLVDIYDDLKKQDSEELRMKKLKTEGKDEDGEEEARVRKQLIDIMVKYKLSSAINDDSDHNEIEKPFYDGVHLDSKVEELWKQVQSSDFSDEELIELRKEFGHHQMKIDEYEQLITQDDNSLDHLTSNKLPKMKLMKKDLKAKHKDLKQDFQKLEAVAQKASAVRDDFTEPRVFDLWAKAVKSNFTEKELASFKEELKHFEHKLKKHNYLKEQLAISQKHADKVDKPEKHIRLEEKSKDYGYKVKKLEHELKTRIDKITAKHSEL